MIRYSALRTLRPMSHTVSHCFPIPRTQGGNRKDNSAGVRREDRQVTSTQWQLQHPKGEGEDFLLPSLDPPRAATFDEVRTQRARGKRMVHYVVVHCHMVVWWYQSSSFCR